MSNTTVACTRGCGTRSKGGVYLCLGIGAGGTLTVEDLILDPVRIWPSKWQRGFKLNHNKGGWNDVLIFVGSEEFYISLWDFVEEARRFGISRKMSPTFPFDELTPGKSQMIFLHRKAYPKFTSSEAEIYPLKVPQKGCRMNWEAEIWKRAPGGWHPKIEKETFCTFSHQHFAGLFHDSYVDNNGEFIIEMPSFSYSGTIPTVRREENQEVELNWSIGAFMAAPISHIEMPKKLNKPAAQRANKAGYEVIVTEW